MKKKNRRAYRTRKPENCRCAGISGKSRKKRGGADCSLSFNRLALWRNYTCACLWKKYRVDSSHNCRGPRNWNKKKTGTLRSRFFFSPALKARVARAPIASNLLSAARHTGGRNAAAPIYIRRCTRVEQRNWTINHPINGASFFAPARRYSRLILASERSTVTRFALP